MKNTKLLGIFVLVIGVGLAAFPFLLSSLLNFPSLSLFLRIWGTMLFATSIGVIFSTSKLGEQTSTPLGRVQFALLILLFTLALTVMLNNYLGLGLAK